MQPMAATSSLTSYVHILCHSPNIRKKTSDNLRGTNCFNLPNPQSGKQLCMKSFVAYPSDLDKVILPQVSPRSSSGKLIAHVELFKKVRTLEGSIVKCGIAAEEGFTRFKALKSMMGNTHHQEMIAFEKYNSQSLNTQTALNYKINAAGIVISDYQQALIQKGEREAITFVPGHVDDSIAGFLMENPELKIAYLNIDLNNYDMTTTCLSFFYPRIVHGGILIIDNYYKKGDDYNAARDYFFGQNISWHSFNESVGPHYIIHQ
jgi:hypothetical protein